MLRATKTDDTSNVQHVTLTAPYVRPLAPEGSRLSRVEGDADAACTRCAALAESSRDHHLLMNTVDLDTVLSVIRTVALRRCDAEGNSLALLDPTRHDLARRHGRSGEGGGMAYRSGLGGRRLGKM